MAIQFKGHKLHYIVDSVADIDSAWDNATTVWVLNEQKMYLMHNGAYISPTSISAQAHIADAATNSPTNAPTNLSGLLITALTGELNNTNTKQNQIATNLNDLATKFNTLLAHLEAQGLQSSS